MKKTSTPYRFFHEHAGWSYDPKAETSAEGKRRCARQLAEAEKRALELGFWVEWHDDPEPCIGCECGSADCACSSGAEHVTLGAILRDSENRILTSLWSICEPSPHYRRVVAAELAMEALPD